MKKVTILKTFTFLMGWIISIQCLGKGLNLMNKPNNLYFTLGFILELGILVGTFYFSFKFGWFLANLCREYQESRKNKQEKVGESK
jgi:hypothetical protein